MAKSHGGQTIFVHFKFSYILIRSKRAVSPVIAILLVLSIALAASVGVNIILQNSVDDPPTVSNQSNVLGTSGDLISSLSFSSEITKLSRDVSLTIANKTDYSEITLQLTFSGNIQSIYVFDVDILVYGEKLDDISQWAIENTIGATYTENGGKFTGYKQDLGTTAFYVVSLGDVNNTRARIPDNTSFVYQIKVGEVPGRISHVIENLKDARVIFNPITYNVAIFHFGSNWTLNEASKQYEDTLSSINGTNNLFYRYNRSNDAYDYKSPLTINISSFVEIYDVAVIDRWAVPVNISSIVYQLHTRNLPLIFYGGLDGFGSSKISVTNSIDFLMTENLTGVTPKIFMDEMLAEGSDNFYNFNNTNDVVLTGLSGQTFWEVPWLPGFLDRGDRRGLDIASLTSTSPLFSYYGETRHRFYNDSMAVNFNSSTLLYDQKGVTMTHKSEVKNSTGEVYSFIWKTSEAFCETLSTKTHGGHLSLIRNNILTVILGETSRVVEQNGFLKVNTIDLGFNGAMNTEFDIQISMSVHDAAIDGDSLVIVLDLPNSLSFVNASDPRYHVFINGVQKTASIAENTTLKSSNKLTFKFKNWFTESIPKDAFVLLTLNWGFNNDPFWLNLNANHTATETWFVTAEWTSGLLHELESLSYSQEIAVDYNQWP